MTFFPANLARVPNLLVSQLNQRNVTGSNLSLLRVQEQLATNRRVNRPSDDAVASSLIGVLDARLEGVQQRQRNLSHAGAVLGTIDQQLGTLIESIRRAKEVASSQIGVGSDAATRAALAPDIASKVDELVAAMNRDFAGIQLFSGGRATSRAIESFRGGYRYAGVGQGLFTDLGDGIDFPITLGADTAIGALSSRVKGSVDLNPALTASTRITDLRGPAEGVTNLGSLNITIDDGTPVSVTVDLSQAQTLGDVVNLIESAIRQADPAALTGAYPTAVGFSGERLAVNNIAVGTTITFSDATLGAAARNLGLDGFSFASGAAVSALPDRDLDPELTLQTRLGDLAPGTALTYGPITLRNGGASGTLTTAATMTIGELQDAVKALNLGIRLEIDPSGDSINIVNEVSGFKMAIEDAGGTAALTLGIRSLAPDTAISVFNHGRGVQIADGNINPVTGLPDADRNTDFLVTLTNGANFIVDLTPADMQTAQTVVNRINAAATAAGHGAIFAASISNGANGIVFSDTAGGAAPVTVTSMNGYAAEDLGLLDGTFTPGAPATFASTDRATVRVDSLISTLIDLREALLANDERGITFAGGQLETDLERLTSAQALVGTRQARAEAAEVRLEDSSLLDESIRSTLRDVDFTEAASRFSLLQTQLQAGYTTISALRPLSLINFLF